MNKGLCYTITYFCTMVSILLAVYDFNATYPVAAAACVVGGVMYYLGNTRGAQELTTALEEENTALKRELLTVLAKHDKDVENLNAALDTRMAELEQFLTTKETELTHEYQVSEARIINNQKESLKEIAELQIGLNTKIDQVQKNLGNLPEFIKLDIEKITKKLIADTDAALEKLESINTRVEDVADDITDAIEDSNKKVGRAVDDISELIAEDFTKKLNDSLEEIRAWEETTKQQNEQCIELVQSINKQGQTLFERDLKELDRLTSQYKAGKTHGR